MRTFEEILKDIKNSCDRVFYSGCNNIRGEVVKAAAEIYVAELQKEQNKE